MYVWGGVGGGGVFFPFCFSLNISPIVKTSVTTIRPPPKTSARGKSLKLIIPQHDGYDVRVKKKKKTEKTIRGKNSKIPRVGPLLFRFVISVMPPTYFVTILFLLQHSTTQIHDSVNRLKSQKNAKLLGF